jgi:hypothetical protein
MTPPAQELAVDPRTGEVWALSTGALARLLVISPDGNITRAGPTLPVDLPAIAVVGGAVWVGAAGPSDWPVRFDPSTLQILADDQGGAVLTAGQDLELVAGANDLWAYSPTAGRLYCVDPVSGTVLQLWDGLTGRLATGGSGPFGITVDGAVVPLVLRGNCRG